MRTGRPISGRAVVGTLLPHQRPDLIHRPGDGTSFRVGLVSSPPETCKPPVDPRPPQPPRGLGRHSRRGGYLAGHEGRAVGQHAVEHDRQLAGQRHLRLFHAGAVFEATCLACHRMNGGGSSKIGPDLNWPMNPTEYFQPSALRRYIRDPASVRTWPDEKMPGFGPDRLSEAELDAVIAYLKHMAEQRTR